MSYGRVTGYVHGRVGGVGIAEVSWPQSAGEFEVRTGYTPAELFIFDEAMPITSEETAKAFTDFSPGGSENTAPYDSVYANDAESRGVGQNSYAAITGAGQGDICETASSGNEVWWAFRLWITGDESGRLDMPGKIGASSVGYYMEYSNLSGTILENFAMAGGSTAVVSMQLPTPIRGVLVRYHSVAAEEAGMAFVSDNGVVYQSSVSLAGVSTLAFQSSDFWATRPTGGGQAISLVGIACGEARMVLADAIGMAMAL